MSPEDMRSTEMVESWYQGDTRVVTVQRANSARGQRSIRTIIYILGLWNDELNHKKVVSSNLTVVRRKLTIVDEQGK
jgi:hypothetical protein